MLHRVEHWLWSCIERTIGIWFLFWKNQNPKTSTLRANLWVAQAPTRFLLRNDIKRLLYLNWIDSFWQDPGYDKAAYSQKLEWLECSSILRQLSVVNATTLLVDSPQFSKISAIASAQCGQQTLALFQGKKPGDSILCQWNGLWVSCMGHC